VLVVRRVRVYGLSNEYRMGDPRAFLAALCSGRSTPIVRILITVSPRMYREALALSVQEHRPDLEVRIAPPEEAGPEVRSFDPHLLVRNDNDGLDPEDLENLLCWIEIIYSDHMDARISVAGQVVKVGNISMDDLLAVVDEATEQVSEDT
jgi:hypothetical protein